MNALKEVFQCLMAVPEKMLCSYRYRAAVLSAALIFSVPALAQNVGISPAGATPHASAALDVDFANKGLLIPRVSLTSTTDVATIATPANSLLVYNTNAGMVSGSIGYWYWDGVKWVKLLSSANEAAWSISGNASTVRGTNFIGTTDNAGLSFRTNNINALNIDSLQNVGIGVENPTRKFEVDGSFRMHKDSFNLLQTSDLLPGLAPGIQYIGNKKNPSDDNAVFLSGLMQLPPAAGNETYSVSGYITNDGSKQNLFLAQKGSTTIVSQGPDSMAVINTSSLGQISLYAISGNNSSNVNLSGYGLNLNTSHNDTSNYINLANNYLNFAHNVNGIGSANMNLEDSIMNLNVNSTISNRSTGVEFKPDNYNIYNNDNGPAATSSTMNFNSNFFKLSVNSPLYHTSFNLTDSSAFFASDAPLKVGIGTSNPTHLLHVYGSTDPVRLEGLQSGSLTDNVITLDGDGVLHYAPPGGSGWSFTGNAGTTAGTDFLGTLDGQDLQFKINNTHAGVIKNDGQTFLGLNAGADNNATQNTGFGAFTLSSASTGGNNTAMGHSALLSNTYGLSNTAVGSSALYHNTNANANTGIGVLALFSNTDGFYNTAMGVSALYSNTTGANNQAAGVNALLNNTTGSGNSASGTGALYSNVTGSGNMASGGNALSSNMTGDNNTASGSNVLFFNINGNMNTAAGFSGLHQNTSGSNNVTSGGYSMYANSTGSNNTASGFEALGSNTTGGENTAIGLLALHGNVTGSNNTGLGNGADVQSGGLTNATAIGYNARVSSSNSMVLGATGASQVNVGIGTTSPTSYLETAGSFAAAIDIISESITLNQGHHTVIINTGSPVITLPVASSDNTRRIYNIINRTAAAITVSTYFDYTGTSVSIASHAKVTIQSDGIDWYQIN